jgi:transposase InsO family protein
MLEQDAVLERLMPALDFALGLRMERRSAVAFGNRCKEAGVRPSTGSVGDAYDNAMCESFFATSSASSSIVAASDQLRCRP